MDVSLTHFQKLVAEIKANSWWHKNFTQRRLEPLKFTYRWAPDSESITDVPNEPFESLLLRVRRLVMSDSAENLLRVRKELKRTAKHELQRTLLDAWHKYWRIAFIKEPYFIEINGDRQIMTPFKVFNTFVNGQLFHSNIAEYNVILHGSDQPAEIRDPLLFLTSQFHATVVSFCLAALGLQVYIDSLDSEQLIVTGHVRGVTDFVWCRNQIPQMDEQYKVFSDWIEDNGGCSSCRWT
jgi:hypothetical protein